MRILGRRILGAATLALLTTDPTHLSLGQVTPDVTQVAANVEGAVRLTWNSQPGEIYQIQWAYSLIDTNTGTITWQILYDGCPSQGTNTFWLDTGSYFRGPAIPHPARTPMRFYRIIDTGPDTTSSEPTVTVISPTNGFTASDTLTINVAASTDQAGGVSTKLYVDGQEMRPHVATTNWTDDSGVTNYLIDTYTINTCEWPNGNHILFATATAESASSGTILGAPPVLEGHGVSEFVTASFDNLISRISFSEPLFNPALGQTQQVSAIFAVNVNWTLEIRDINSNAVRTATGSGSTMHFNWDGTGDGGASLDPGVYCYYVSAQTNGQSFQTQGPAGDGGSDSPPLPSFASASAGDSMEWFGVPADGSGTAVPLTLYPLGYDTNSLRIFQAQRSEVMPPRTSLLSAGTISGGGGEGVTPMYSGASSQAAPPAPDRPGTAPKEGTVGKFGMGWQTYKANGTSGFTPALPLATFPPLRTYVQMEGHGTANPPNFGPLRLADLEAANFGVEMVTAGWDPACTRGDNDLRIGDLRGTGSPFNDVDIAFLVLHCVYGDTLDTVSDPHPFKQMYFPITAGTDSQYLRMSEMKLGGSDGTNGLKWVALAACSSLYHANWSSMQGQQVYPYNSGLHLLLGVDTKNQTREELGADWVKFMIGDPKQSPPVRPLTIREAWYTGSTHACTNAHAIYSINPMIFAVAGDRACQNDMLQTKTNTVMSGGSWFYDTRQVYPPQ